MSDLMNYILIVILGIACIVFVWKIMMLDSSNMILNKVTQTKIKRGVTNAAFNKALYIVLLFWTEMLLLVFLEEKTAYFKELFKLLICR